MAAELGSNIKISKCQKRKQPVFKKKEKKSSVEKTEIQILEEKRALLDPSNADDIERFSDLPLSKNMLRGLQDYDFTVPTKIQKQSLMLSLRGLDVVGGAKTGSGKTLAFLIPMLELLYQQQWSNIDGIGALVITPTRELAYQIFEVLRKVGTHFDFSAGLVIGGKDLKFEWNRVGRCNILICTPGRLLQHLHENPEFHIDSMQMLILDEADQCLSMGFADTMNFVFDALPNNRQTLLFSATQTKDVKDLIRVGLKQPVYCSAHEYSKTATPKKLDESFVVCDQQDKINFLWSFVKYHKRRKVLVFLATCKQVKFTFDMFCKFRPGVSVMSLHGGMHQLRRMAVFDEFCKKQHALLLATDVAARGLDIPAVDWVVQLDCPEDANTYIHRAGRTARYSSAGASLLCLRPSEESAMFANLKQKNITIEQIQTDPSKLQDLTSKLKLEVSKCNQVNECAQRAFKSYVKHVTLLKDKKVFDPTTIDFDAFARSLGLSRTPRVRFLEKWIKQKNSKGEARQRKQEWGNESTNGDMESLFEVKEDGAITNTKKNYDSDLEDDFMTSAATEENEEPSSEDETAAPTKTVRRSEKVITKIAAAKELLKTGRAGSSRIVFKDEEASEQESAGDCIRKASTRDHFGVALAIQKMSQVDKEDKKRHSELKKAAAREEKRKAKEERRKNSMKKDEEEEEEESEDGDSVTRGIIDNLPDPDKFYGKQSGGEESSGENDSDHSNIEEEDCTPLRPQKRSASTRAGKPSKRRRQTGETESEDTSALDTMNVVDKEQLALLLLREGR